MEIEGEAKERMHSVHPTLTCKEALFYVAKILHKVHSVAICRYKWGSMIWVQMEVIFRCGNRLRAKGLL